MVTAETLAPHYFPNSQPETIAYGEESREERSERVSIQSHYHGYPVAARRAVAEIEVNRQRRESRTPTLRALG